MTELGDQLDIFDLIDAPAALAPVVRPGNVIEPFIRELPANYARVATQGRPWEWHVSRDHIVYGGGHEATKEGAETRIAWIVSLLDGTRGTVIPPERDGRPWVWSSPITSDPAKYERVTGNEPTMSAALGALMEHLKEVKRDPA